jgi:hypothetical protein
VRQLHVVSLSEDGRYVLLAPSKNATAGTFRVPLDGRLTAAVRGELPRPGETGRPESALTPRDIQARLRAGESVEEIARSAGVPAARVERFAGPVEAERDRIIQAARTAVLSRSRRGPSAVPLGEAVDAHLAEAVTIDDGSAQWSARKGDEGVWLVEVVYSSRGRRKKGGWYFDPAAKELAAADASSSVLGFVEPDDDAARPSKVVAAAGPEAAAPRRKPSKRRRTPMATERRSAAAVKVPAAAKKAPAAAKAPAPKRAPAEKKKAPAAATPPPAAAKTAPPPEAVKPAERRPAPKRTAVPAKAPAARRKVPAAAKAPAARRTARPPGAETPQSPPQLRVVPDPDAPTRGRATVPGWADVLLSTTPPSRSASPPAEDGS